MAVQCHDRLLRELLIGWLNRQPRLVTVGRVGGAEDLVALCRAHRPDLVVLEADAAGLDAAALIKRLSDSPRPRTVGLHHASGASALRRLRDAGFDQLVDYAGGLVSLAEAVERLTPENPAAPRGPTVRLTDRELDILRLLGGSLRSAGIAETLGISVHTVENHKRRVFAKLDVHSETHAVARAIREGLLTGLLHAPAPASAPAAPADDLAGELADSTAAASSTFTPTTAAATALAAPLTPTAPHALTTPAASADLTPREREILSLAAAGCTVKQTAHTLGVSVKTVESIQRHLFCKLGVRGRPGAVAAVYGSTETDIDDTSLPSP